MYSARKVGILCLSSIVSLASLSPSRTHHVCLLFSGYHDTLFSYPNVRLVTPLLQSEVSQCLFSCGQPGPFNCPSHYAWKDTDWAVLDQCHFAQPRAKEEVLVPPVRSNYWVLVCIFAMAQVFFLSVGSRIIHTFILSNEILP